MATHCSIFPGESHGQRSLAGYSPRGHKRMGHDTVTKQQFLITLEILGYHFRASFAQCEKKFLSYFVSRMSLVCSPPISLCVSFSGRGALPYDEGWTAESRPGDQLALCCGEPSTTKLLFKSALLEPISPILSPVLRLLP